ncbi:DUF6985 domain-containing protein [Gymnodinialimonas hymeniacidonis]|uniref:DUF6985 domain-containing protein n=1 Tax=Gymnodinialimonas hymeniacidonis TaxID=3126508 RepID=UPI0034C5B4B1
MVNYPPPETYSVPLFSGRDLTRWDPEPLPPDGQAAFDRFMALTPAALGPVSRHVFAYYQDMMRHLDGTGWPGVPLPKIDRAEDVWEHVTPEALSIERATPKSGPWFVGIEANVPWEVEHGLWMTWEDGDRIAYVGQVLGHLTNVATYADPSLEHVVFAGIEGKEFTTYRDTA